MNFYEHQERARKQTGRLLILLFVALTTLILLIAFVIAGLGYVLGLSSARLDSYETGQSLWEVAAQVFDWQYMGSISLAVIVVVSVAALFRMVQLSSGGRAIAEQLGGRLLNTNPRTASEKRLLNIVEEMAIAAGIPVPGVYLIDEDGINAFAAGFRSADAVIGVTQGAIEQLTRQELQGVVAHEFSHVLNGDMRLNLRLIGIIYGIVVISVCGRYLLQGGRHSSRDRGFIVSMGLVLLVLGYLGVFFGNLIKAAISRQREFLADASAVQFTRSREGIAGALKKIGGQLGGATWRQHDASEISHMLFAQGLRFHFFSHLMATHPALDKRIKRIDPQWNGQFTVHKEKNVNADQDISLEQKPARQGSQVASAALIAGLDRSTQLSDDAIAQAGASLSVLTLKFDELCQQVHQPYTACALVYAMLIDLQGRLAVATSLQQRQWQDLQDHQAPGLVKQTQAVYKHLQQLTPSQVMMMLDLALPVLKLLSDNQYRQFKQQMLQLIKLDKKIELREWALFNLVNYFCRPTKLHAFHLVSLRSRKPAVAKLLSALASLGEQGESSFKQVVIKELGFDLRWYPETELTIQSLSQALEQVRLLKPLEKPQLLKACIRIVEHDGVIDTGELEIVACIAQAIDCPLPQRSI